MRLIGDKEEKTFVGDRKLIIKWHSIKWESAQTQNISMKELYRYEFDSIGCLNFEPTCFASKEIRETLIQILLS